MQENAQSKSLQSTRSTSPCLLPWHLRLPSAGLLLWQCDLLLLLCEGESYQTARPTHGTLSLSDRTLHHFGCWILLLLLLICVSTIICNIQVH